MKLLITLLFLFSQAVEASNFKSQAPKVADTLKKNLMGNLQKQMAEHGVLKALDFCHLNVKDLAQETAAQFKGAYEFGRVSHKVRNPNNSPKDWKIGRASCRERVEVWVEAGPLREKTVE